MSVLLKMILPFIRPSYSLLLLLLLFSMNQIYAQSDKKSDDELLYNLLSDDFDDDNWHPTIVINDSLLMQTNEQGIYLHKGDTFQIKSLNDNLYLRSLPNQAYEVIFDKKYPVESLTNLLLNRVVNNTLTVELTLHVYGNKKKQLIIPMQRIYDRLARHVRLYTMINSVSAERLQATLVMHHPSINVIHLFVINVKMSDLFSNKGVLQADLYGNIPQNNIKDLFQNTIKR